MRTVYVAIQTIGLGYRIHLLVAYLVQKILLIQITGLLKIEHESLFMKMFVVILYVAPKDGVFDSKSFMKVYKDDFLKIVPAEHIALNLEIEDVIDDVLCRDMKNSARSVAASILYGHLSKTAKRETIADLCKVMKDRSTGFPKMRDLADAMEKNKPYKP